MKSLNVVSQYGYLYDRESGRRLELVSDFEYCIIGSTERSFEFIGVEERPTLSSEESILAAIKGEPGLEKHKKILDAEKSLYFRLIDPYEGRQHLFRVKLLEPLFLYSKAQWAEKRDGRKAALYDCHCKLEENPTKSLRFFEQLYAKSLNEIYKKSFVHYFGNKGNPACNAFEKFYMDPDCTFGIDNLRDF